MYDFNCAVDMINESYFYWEIIDLFNDSFYDWKPKLAIGLIHNLPSPLIIPDGISKTNHCKEFSLLL